MACFEIEMLWDLNNYNDALNPVHQISECDLITPISVYKINNESESVIQQDGMISQWKFQVFSETSPI